MKLDNIRVQGACLTALLVIASQTASTDATPGVVETATVEETVVETETDEETAVPVTAGYKKGFFIQSEDEKYKLLIGGRVQARFTWVGLENDPNEAHFSIPRARLFMKGHVFEKALKYKFQVDFGKGFATLQDFWAQYEFIPKTLALRVGSSDPSLASKSTPARSSSSWTARSPTRALKPVAISAS